MATTVPFIRRSHILIVLSPLVVNTRRERGQWVGKDDLVDITVVAWRVSSGLPVRRSQRIALPSKEHERTYKGAAKKS